MTDFKTSTAHAATTPATISPKLERAAEKLAQLRANGIPVERLDPIERARRNPRSLRAAVTAKCWECCGSGQDAGTRRAIAECTVRSCALHPHRPFHRADREP